LGQSRRIELVSGAPASAYVVVSGAPTSAYVVISGAPASPYVVVSGANNVRANNGANLFAPIRP